MVVVVGGGATGLGVAWDLLLRGIPVTLLEQFTLAAGTSGRFHGLLHSGGRYAVSDPAAARECVREGQILARIAPYAIEACGGLFVETADTDPGYAATWLAACRAAGIPVRAVEPAQLRHRLPSLSPAINRAFWVPDGVLEGFHLLRGLAAAIVGRGGRILERTRLAQVEADAGAVAAVWTEGPGGRQRIPCRAVVNAAGPWAGEVSAVFGDRLQMRLSWGLMVIFAHRLTPWVVNRLAPPGDGDILVPHQAVSIFGTTDEPHDRPDPPPVTATDVRRLVQLGRILFPTMPEWRVLRAFAGVRPLYDPDAERSDRPRRISRDFTVVDHAARGGLAGSFSVVGGKWTTFRLMAERTGDAVASYLGEARPSQSAATPIPPPPPNEDHPPWWCECETVGYPRLWTASQEPLDTLRVHTWATMGPCQGTFCLHRLTALRQQRVGWDTAQAEAQALRAERLRGMEAALWGDNARQWALLRAVRRQSLAERGQP